MRNAPLCSLLAIALFGLAFSANPSAAQGKSDRQTATPSPTKATGDAGHVTRDKPATPGRGTTTQRVIGPGHEPLLQKMLDGKSLGATSWRFVGFSIDRDHAIVEYQTSKAKGVVRLRVEHRDAAEAPSATTRTFALTLVDGENMPAVPALLTAVKGLVAASEDAWVWDEMTQSRGDRRGPKPASEGGRRDHRRDLGPIFDAAADAVRRKDYDEAGERLKEALEASAKLSELERAWAETEAGLLLVELGDEERAKALFAKAHAKTLDLLAGLSDAAPRERRFRVQQLRLRAALGSAMAVDLPQELDALLKSARDDGARCELASLGEDLARLGALDEAFKAVTIVLTATPKCAHGYRSVGLVGFRYDRWPDTASLLQAGLKHHPDDVGVVSQVANYYKFLGRRDEALALLEGLVENGGRGGGLLGELMGMYGRDAESINRSVAKYTARFEKNPSDWNAAFFAGALLHYKREWDRSTEHLLAAEPHLPEVPRLYLYIAMNHHRSGGDHQQAVAYIHKAVAAGSTDPDVFYCRGVIFMDDKPAEAARDLDRYLNMTRDSFDVPHSKTNTVQAIVDGLKKCVDAPVPSKCVGIEAP